MQTNHCSLLSQKMGMSTLEVVRTHHPYFGVKRAGGGFWYGQYAGLFSLTWDIWIGKRQIEHYGNGFVDMPTHLCLQAVGIQMVSSAQTLFFQQSTNSMTNVSRVGFKEDWNSIEKLDKSRKSLLQIIVT